jgi:hypothetical protein
MDAERAVRIDPANEDAVSALAGIYVPIVRSPEVAEKELTGHDRRGSRGTSN